MTHILFWTSMHTNSSTLHSIIIGNCNKSRHHCKGNKTMHKTWHVFSAIFFPAELSRKLNDSQSDLTMADLSSSQMREDMKRKSIEFVKQYDNNKENKVGLPPHNKALILRNSKLGFGVSLKFGIVYCILLHHLFATIDVCFWRATRNYGLFHLKSIHPHGRFWKKMYHMRSVNFQIYLPSVWILDWVYGWRSKCFI